MVEAIFKGNGGARVAGLRKWRAKQRSAAQGGLLFARESIDAFRAEALSRGVPFPEVRETMVGVEQVAVAPK